MLNVSPGWGTSIEETLWASKERPRSSHLAFGTLRRMAHQSRGQLYALIDSARDEEVFRFLTLGEEQSRSLFQGSPYERLFSVAPILMSCRRHNQITSWLTWCKWTDRIATYIVSPAGFDDVFDHFKRLTIVEDAQGVSLFLRLADPLVFQAFIESCTLEERFRFFGPSKLALLPASPTSLHYYSLDDLADHISSEDRGSLDPEWPWILSQAQESSLDSLVVSCQKYKFFHELRGSKLATDQGLDDSGLYAAIESAIHQAESFEIYADRAVLGFVEASLCWGSKFHHSLGPDDMRKLFHNPMISRENRRRRLCSVLSSSSDKRASLATEPA